MRRVLVLATLLTCGLASLTLSDRRLFAQAKPGPIPKIQQVKDNLYFIGSSDPNPGVWTGGNTAVFVTANHGVVLVDTKLPGYGKGIIEQVRSITDKPVSTIINTHTHNDHSGSNVEFPATVEFVAHENTKKHFSLPSCRPVTNCQSFKGENAKFLPKKTFADRLTLFSGKDQVDLYHFGVGHTNGDAFIVFPSVRAMHTGDMFQRRNVPAVNGGDGGSGIAFADTIAKAVAGIKNVDLIVPGHSNTVLAWDDLRNFADFYRDFLTTTQKALASGKSADEVARAYVVPERFKAKGFTSDTPELLALRVKALVEQIAVELGKK